MSYGPYRAFDATISSFATLSGEVNLGRAWKNVYIEVPTMTSNSTIHMQAANNTGGTYRRVTLPVFNSTTVAAPSTYQVVSSVTNQVVPAPAGLQYVKIESVNILSFTAGFKIICSD